MNQAYHLWRTARVHGDLPAVALGTHVTHDYRRLADRAARLAEGLLNRLGLVRGDTVAIVQKNSTFYHEAQYAIWWAGLAAVPVNAKLHPKELAYILDNSQAKLVLSTDDLSDVMEQAVVGLDPMPQVLMAGSPDYERLLTGDGLPDPVEVPDDDLAWLFYTSGTTGQPKGAMITHLNLLMQTMNFFVDVDTISPGDAIIHSAPLSHGSGLYGLPHTVRAGVHVIPESGGFDPAENLRLIEAWPGTGQFLAPTMVHRLINDPRTGDADTTNLKTVYYGGGPMYVADLVQAMDMLGQKFVQIYGQGEAPMTITGLSRDLHGMVDHPRYMDRLGSAGTARADVQVRVVDADDQPVPVGETGEIIARGRVVMKGYWRNAAATAETLRGGWLHTGDVGAFDADGFLTLKDRSKDMIISGGSNIYPREVEEVLLQHPGVAEVSVVGRPHADWGEEVVAFVVRGENGAADEPSLDRLCLDNIARFKRPKDYLFVDALPKNNYGKVLKTELRARLGEG